MREHDPRKYAAECLALAQSALSEADRLMFVEMAQVWLSIAERDTPDPTLASPLRRAAAYRRRSCAGPHVTYLRMVSHVSAGATKLTELRGEPAPIAAIGSVLAQMLADTVSEPLPPGIEAVLSRLA
jgi:hypothetical protein